MKIYFLSIIRWHAKFPDIKDTRGKVHFFQTETNANRYLANRIFESLNREICILEMKNNAYNGKLCVHDNEIIYYLQFEIGKILSQKNKYDIEAMYNLQSKLESAKVYAYLYFGVIKEIDTNELWCEDYTVEDR